jgi:hypothetical protein
MQTTFLRVIFTIVSSDKDGLEEFNVRPKQTFRDNILRLWKLHLQRIHSLSSITEDWIEIEEGVMKRETITDEQIMDSIEE